MVACCQCACLFVLKHSQPLRSGTCHRICGRTARPLRQVKKKAIKPRGRRGFGGRWRAFVRLTSLGQKGRPHLSTIGMRYKAAEQAGDQVLERAAQLGRAATVGGRALVPRAGQSAFGPTSRDDNRLRQQRTRASALQLVAARSTEDAAIALADHLAIAGTDLQSCLTAARSALRTSAGRRKKAEDEARQTLAAFSDGVGGQSLADLSMSLPGIEGIKGLVPVPHPRGLCFEAPGVQPEHIADAVSWAYQSKQANASSCMKEYWAKAHTLLGGQQSAPATDKTDPPTMCQLAGRCICSGVGKDLRALRDAVLRSMKRTFPAGSSERKRLLEGFVVLRLSCVAIGNDPHDPGCTGVAKDIFLHVGMMYLSPYRPTYLCLDLVSGIVGEAASEGGLWVKAHLGHVRG